MKLPNQNQGALVIRTQFGGVSADKGDNFELSMEQMIDNPTWRKLVAAEGGVFCYCPFEQEIAY